MAPRVTPQFPPGPESKSNNNNVNPDAPEGKAGFFPSPLSLSTSTPQLEVHRADPIN